MQPKSNVPLRTLSTMRLGGTATYAVDITTRNELVSTLAWANEQALPALMIGSGSNIVWRDEGFEGLLIVNKIKGIEALSDDDSGVTARIAAGEIWDEAVAWSVNRNLSGIEFLSRIPGMAGAAPVQNIGAYGAELADVLKEVAAYDSHTDTFETILAEGCDFAYRSSRFKAADKGRFVILSITLNLKKENPRPPFYESLEKYLTSQGITEYTPQTIRSAVTEVRKIRLPDPSVVNNNGSFFTNPFVDEPKFKELQAKFPDIKGWPGSDGRVKLAAGWLVEQAGFKETHDESGMATWPGNALVLVNERAKTTASLIAFRQKILDKVQEMFGVTLEQEPELLP
jgi:UDP-N-acetylmuramate dehydrogenase